VYSGLFGGRAIGIDVLFLYPYRTIDLVVSLPRRKYDIGGGWRTGKRPEEIYASGGKYRTEKITGL
jgi:hypothetical protein